MIVEDINIREILTTNSQKSIEIEVRTNKGITNSSVSLGKNGIYNNRQLLPEDAIKKFLQIKRHFVDDTFYEIADVDFLLRKIDISPDFREIGGNVAFGISSCMLKAFAKFQGQEVHNYLSNEKPQLPTPLGIIIEKNKNETDFQEFLIYPVEQKSFTKEIKKLSSVFSDVNSTFERERNLTITKVFHTLSKFTTNLALEIGVNLNASSLWNGRRYTYSTHENLTPQEQLLFVQDIAKNYPVGYFEDPFHENDFVLFSTLKHRLPTRLVAGNELYSNNSERIKTGIELKATNAIVLKPHETGTISDFISIVKKAKKNNVEIIVEIPQNDTDDLLACHLATGLNCEKIKLGLDGHYVNKINELVRIEEKLK